uniref:Cytochrome c oxidase subunit 2 n=3 Tax=Postandrilus TaxID=1127232 RepID=G9JLF0_9ANNE|nr:cytochrome oxidase subunit II [Postandrilus lavellei]AEW43205.1 cytochrome oxidase subunit II [Postandrilus medoakus]AEW43223.1 cytochrome oxidase subunit II [Postandrilus sp. MPL-2011]AEW43196.1 cytochrome oxidase subunit II [Postandrilus lavellei]AEW43197.1 cytochrome oxidase subunit II [Postandrilus lavellei]
MPNWGQLAFQDAASPVMLQLISFHDHALLVLTLVLTVVGYALMALMLNKYVNRYILEAQTVETVWTILPALILLVLALPSLRILYVTDEVSQPSITVKTIGHQWYWSYEYTDFLNVEMDSYMTPTDDLAPGDYRLLEVDNRMVVPMKLEIRMLITAADVIHSWTIPALGVKVDAVPGRLNQIGFTTMQPGIFYGQCSEICGANHSFMPIVVEAINTSSFMKWITNFNK